jgi:hypothetical protein
MILGDTFIAMRNCPVPLRFYAEFYQKAHRWGTVFGQCDLDDALKAMALKHRFDDLTGMFTNLERACMHSVIMEIQGLGLHALQKQARDTAWQCAGLDGILDPLEIAKEGGADEATLDYVLRWRMLPYAMEAPGVSRRF